MERFALGLSAFLLLLSAGRLAFGLTAYERSEAGLVGALLVGAGCTAFWAADPSRWIHGDTYRKFVAFLNVPLGVLLATSLLIGRRPVARTPSAGQELPDALIGIVLLMHTGCLFVQSTNYAQLRTRLRHELAQAQNGVLFLTADHWAFSTPLRIWALPYNSILLQGRRPIAIATFARSVEASVNSTDHSIRFSGSPEVTIAPGGWFQFDQLREVDRLTRDRPGVPVNR